MNEKKSCILISPRCWDWEWVKKEMRELNFHFKLIKNSHKKLYKTLLLDGLKGSYDIGANKLRMNEQKKLLRK